MFSDDRHHNAPKEKFRSRVISGAVRFRRYTHCDYRRLMQTLQIHLHPRKLASILPPSLGVAVQQNWPIVI